MLYTAWLRSVIYVVHARDKDDALAQIREIIFPNGQSNSKADDVLSKEVDSARIVGTVKAVRVIRTFIESDVDYY